MKKSVSPESSQQRCVGGPNGDLVSLLTTAWHASKTLFDSRGVIIPFTGIFWQNGRDACAQPSVVLNQVGPTLGLILYDQ